MINVSLVRPMIRHWPGVIMTLLVVALAYRFYSGWLMLGLILILLTFNLRKKLPHLPLGRAKNWSLCHYYLGVMLVMLFGIHIDFALPMGYLNWLLFGLTIIATLSGIIGLLLSRYLAKNMSHHQEAIIFERIPQLRQHVIDNIELELSAALSTLQATALTAFYQQQLRPFLQRPSHRLSHWLGSNRPYQHWQKIFNHQREYLGQKDKDLLAIIESQVLFKVDLDNQYASQSLLKYWLFIHIPASYCLLIATLYHVLIVYAFGSNG